LLLWGIWTKVTGARKGEKGGERRQVRGSDGAGASLSKRALAAALSLALGAVLVGCSPKGGAEVTPLNSKLFSAVQVIGGRGVAPGQFNKPRSLACDRDDNLYVVDITGRVQKFDANGHWLLQWQMPQTDLGKPKGMG